MLGEKRSSVCVLSIRIAKISTIEKYSPEFVVVTSAAVKVRLLVVKVTQGTMVVVFVL